MKLILIKVVITRLHLVKVQRATNARRKESRRGEEQIRTEANSTPTQVPPKRYSSRQRGSTNKPRIKKIDTKERNEKRGGKKEREGEAEERRQKVRRAIQERNNRHVGIPFTSETPFERSENECSATSYVKRTSPCAGSCHNFLADCAAARARGRFVPTLLFRPVTGSPLAWHIYFAVCSRGCYESQSINKLLPYCAPFYASSHLRRRRLRRRRCCFLRLAALIHFLVFLPT